MPFSRPALGCAFAYMQCKCRFPQTIQSSLSAPALGAICYNFCDDGLLCACCAAAALLCNLPHSKIHVHCITLFFSYRFYVFYLKAMGKIPLAGQSTNGELKWIEPVSPTMEAGKKESSNRVLALPCTCGYVLKTTVCGEN